jgi:hypothetical protein
VDSASTLTRDINNIGLIIMVRVPGVTAIIVTRTNIGGTDGIGRIIGTITTGIITTGITIDDFLVGPGAAVAKRFR